jgi:hypothetical protein
VVVGDFRDCLLAWTGAEESPCSIVIFCCEEAGVLDASSAAVSSSLNKLLTKPNNQTPNKKDGGVVIYKVGTDNIITEATNRLSARLKSKYGEDSVVLVTKNKDGSFD